MLMPSAFDTPVSRDTARSVACSPGSRLLTQTPLAATCRDMPATNPVSPDRALFDSPSSAMGDRTAADVMLTTRPQPRSIMPGTSACISAIALSMLPSSARMKSSRSQSVQTPGGGPPALLTRMSACPPSASSTLARPSPVVMSAATGVTVTPCLSAISDAVRSSVSGVRALMTRSTPSAASASAQPRPRPFDEAQTSAFLPLIPRSMPFPLALVSAEGTCPCARSQWQRGQRRGQPQPGRPGRGRWRGAYQ